MPIAIRPYRDADHLATAQLWLASWRSTGVAVAQRATEAALFKRLPAELAGGWDAYLARDGDTLVGFLALKPADSCLDQLFVAPAAQGTGVGRALLDFAKRQLPGGLWLHTAAENVRARRFYERNGLRPGDIRTHPRLGHQIIVYRWP